MNERIRELYAEAVMSVHEAFIDRMLVPSSVDLEFAELIVRECVDKIETHRIPVGNSAAGEMACEMTYSALMEIRDEIREHFGVEE